MTNKQYQEAVAIYNRIKELQDVLNFHSRNKNVLVYAYINCNKDYTIHPGWARNPILPLLDKHDAMIRQEIEQEIESLKKEIENL